MNKKFKILLAEDDFFQRQRMEIILRKNNFEVILAKDGKTALEYIASSPPDLLLTDIHMPKMDGYELAAKTKKLFPCIFILISTATARRETIQQAFDAGATDYVRKPVDSLELIARINNLIKLKKAEENLNEALSELKTKNKVLKKLSITDELTGLNNRRSFFEQLKKHIYDTERYTHPITLFMFDIDSFKHVNDNFGHQVGDQVLRDIAEVLKNNTRKTDVAGRFGGDEFLVMFNHTEINEAAGSANSLMKKINSIRIGDTDEKIKISGGLFQHPADMSLNELMAKTDSLLYKAKENGKNRIEF